MITFPGCKINIGLNVIAKRADGFHDIESVFYPVPFCDAVEIVPADKFSIQKFGLDIPGNDESNLVVKAYRVLKERFHLPEAAIAILKKIPMGAGLGGGSSDGAAALKILNGLFSLNLSKEELKAMAAELGSDCPFFIDNVPAFVTGRGEILEPVSLSLKGWHITLVFPGIHISAAEAYRNISLQHSRSGLDLKKTIELTPLPDWKETVKNDFEDYAFGQFPVLAELKNDLYKSGAEYASMTGSGSCIYGLSKNPVETGRFSNYNFWQGTL